MPGEAEGAAEPFDGSRRVAVTERRDDGGGVSPRHWVVLLHSRLGRWEGSPLSVGQPTTSHGLRLGRNLPDPVAWIWGLGQHRPCLGRGGAGELADIADEMGLIVVAERKGEFGPALRYPPAKGAHQPVEANDASEKLGGNADMIAKQVNDVLLAIAEFSGKPPHVQCAA